MLIIWTDWGNFKKGGQGELLRRRCCRSGEPARWPRRAPPTARPAGVTFRHRGAAELPAWVAGTFPASRSHFASGATQSYNATMRNAPKGTASASTLARPPSRPGRAPGRPASDFCSRRVCLRRSSKNRYPTMRTRLPLVQKTASEAAGTPPSPPGFRPEPPSNTFRQPH